MVCTSSLSIFVSARNVLSEENKIARAFEYYILVNLYFLPANLC